MYSLCVYHALHMVDVVSFRVLDAYRMTIGLFESPDDDLSALKKNQVKLSHDP